MKNKKNHYGEVSFPRNSMGSGEEREERGGEERRREREEREKERQRDRERNEE